MKKYASVAILLAGVLWGTMGLFTRYFTGIGFTASQSAFLRLFFAAVIFVAIGFVKYRSKLKIKLHDVPLFVITGVVSIFLMSFCYFKAISTSSMSVAAILLYTAPFFVTIASAILYKEKITMVKTVALVTAFVGCVLISGVGGTVSTIGILFGLLSGITYASYSIFGKKLLEKYDSYTVTLWCFVFAALGSACVVNPISTMTQLIDHGIGVVLIAVTMGLITAFLPFTLYTYGLNYTEAGKASVMATIEPMTATVAGALVFSEYPDIFGVTGIILILAAIVLLNKKSKDV